MAHLNTGPGEHDPTASAFIVRLDTPEPVLLLHRHKKINKWLQFGGHVEKTENPWQALTHEIAEESGYGIGQLQILQPPHCLRQLTDRDAVMHPQPVAYMTHNFFADGSHKHTDASFAFVTGEAPSHDLAAGESKTIEAFTLAELQALPDNEIIYNVREIGIFVLEVCLSEWERVPTSDFR